MASRIARPLAVLMVATLAAVPAGAGPQEWNAPAPPDAQSLDVAEVTGSPRPEFGAVGAIVSGVPEVVWPQGGESLVTVNADSSGWVLVGGLRMRVRPTPIYTASGRAAAHVPIVAQAPAQVVVRVHDHQQAMSMGVGGLLLEFAQRDAVAQPTYVNVEIDYSGFRRAYGGDWSSRLRVVALDDCGSGSMAGGATCRTLTELPTSNDHDSGVLATTVPLSSDGGFTVLAVAGGPAGDNGDYSATSLSPASTWQVSQQTGAFSWSYPLRMVPGVAGPQPSLALGYSSQAVDGRTVNTNSQGSWIGDGWDMWPGFIERSYRPCLEDTDPVDGDPANNASRPTGDLCWVTDNATMSLNGRAVELVKDGPNRFRPQSDDGSRIERLFDPSLGNGTYNGEYWRVTTVDGTQYFFGRHRRQGFPSDTAAMNSTMTVPVYGNHPGEPCYKTGDFAGSRCTQGWRWNLDYVVDTHGNTMSLFYSRETGAYGRELDPGKRTIYHRGGYLTRIEYGTRAGTEHTAPVPARVVFDVADRCLPDVECSPSNPAAWPDTPWDQFCQSGTPCTDQLAPTFWTQKRLDRVRTQVWRGSSYSTVDSWQLRHVYLDAGAADGEGVPMWLAGITRTGHGTEAAGDEVAQPEITFDTQAPLPNRVDGPADGKTQINRFRIRRIWTEHGTTIGIEYSPPECTKGSLPAPHTNTKRCFPQWYALAGDPTLDWFHKYVVTAVYVDDVTGASPRMETHYQYLDQPAWHYVESELVPEDRRTWSSWRGYSKVRVIAGNDQETRSAAEYLYMRGMHGDRAGPSGGTKDVQITDSQGTSITDHEAHAGFLREQIVLNGPGGAWVTGTIQTPWRHGPTATSGPLKAYLTGTASVRTRTALAGGDVRWTKVTTSFDTTYGMPTQVDDLGDEATSSDDLCTRYQYARNTSKWIVDRVSRVETVGVRCGTSPKRPDDVLSDTRTFYDNPDVFGAAPTRGLPVKVQEVDSWAGADPVWLTTSQVSYDSHGRAVSVSDALGRTTTTAYTPATGGPVTRIATANPLGHTVLSELDQAWGVPLKITDANGRVTNYAYDGLGRLTAVWLPGRTTDQPANATYEYALRADAPSAVTTRTLLPDGSNYTTSVALLDGFLRPRQTQSEAPGGGRVIADTVYNSRGLVAWTTRGYYNAEEPSTTLVTTGGQPTDTGVLEYAYDGVGRRTSMALMFNGSQLWRTTYVHGGDRLLTTPPTGGTATSTIVDARGRTVALRQYHGPTPTGSYDQTTYAYTRRGELASITDQAGNTWSYVYDLRGRPIEVSHPDRGTTITTYDAAGQVRTVTDGRGVTLGYTYDQLGRTTSVRDGSPTGPKRAEWIYDTLPGGVGKLTRSIRYDDGEQYVTEVVGYDSGGRPTGTRVVIPARETGLAGTYTTVSTYRPDGSLATTTLPAVGGLPQERMVFSYNDVGLPTGMVSPWGQYTFSVTYDKLGELVQRVIGPFGKRTALTYTYDKATGFLTNASAIPELKPEVMDRAYSYDDAGNLLRVADSRGSEHPQDTQCYRYDYLRRLVAAWTPAATGDDNCDADPAVADLGGPAPYWHSYTYDSSGNRLSRVVHTSAGDITTTYAHPAAGSPQSHTVLSAETTGPAGTTVDTYAYDAVGNMTGRKVGGLAQTLEYDAEGRLATVEDDEHGDVQVVYEANGGRLIRRDGEGATLYLPGGQELRYDAATMTVSGTRYYTHLGTLIAIRRPGQLTWMVTDHHNTAEIALRDSDLSPTFRRTTPFGEPRGPSVAWPGDKGFVGGTEDPSGLVHLGARMYDQGLGRFTSVDPVVNTSDPQQMHGYAYANNNPIGLTDPSGLSPARHDAGGCSGLLFGGYSSADVCYFPVDSNGNRLKPKCDWGDMACYEASYRYLDNYLAAKRAERIGFAVSIVVGVAAAAATAAICGGCGGPVVAAMVEGSVSGLASNVAGYATEVALGPRDFDPRDAFATAVGGATGGAISGPASKFGVEPFMRFTSGTRLEEEAASSVVDAAVAGGIESWVREDWRNGLVLLGPPGMLLYGPIARLDMRPVQPVARWVAPPPANLGQPIVGQHPAIPRGNNVVIDEVRVLGTCACASTPIVGQADTIPRGTNVVVDVPPRLGGGSSGGGGGGGGAAKFL